MMDEPGTSFDALTADKLAADVAKVFDVNQEQASGKIYVFIYVTSWQSRMIKVYIEP